MKTTEVLPDGWDDVAHYRYKALISKTFFNFFNGGNSIEGCVGCPCLASGIRGGILFTRCKAITKCIKQYPHILDNEEFKSLK